jgi:putative ABC transport system permease protein
MKDVERIRNELNAMSDGLYRAWTKPELTESTSRVLMQTGFIAILLNSVRVVGFIIGVVITWQTLRGAILANIKEFASLRALGVSIGQLRGVVMELSVWVGLLGIVASAVLMIGINFLAGMVNLPMGYEPVSLLTTGMLLLLISIGSGALTLGALKKGEPADLLK